MRPTSPSNRISAYYDRTAGVATTGYQSAFPYRHVAASAPVAYTRGFGGRIAGMAASVLQLAVSALCVAGALSTWLGHPIGISVTTAVFLGGVLFGTVSLLQLYSVLTGAASDTRLAAYDE